MKVRLWYSPLLFIMSEELLAVLVKKGYIAGIYAKHCIKKKNALSSKCFAKATVLMFNTLN